MLACFKNFIARFYSSPPPNNFLIFMLEMKSSCNEEGLIIYRTYSIYNSENESKLEALKKSLTHQINNLKHNFYFFDAEKFLTYCIKEIVTGHDEYFELHEIKEVNKYPDYPEMKPFLHHPDHELRKAINKSFKNSEPLPEKYSERSTLLALTKKARNIK